MGFFLKTKNIRFSTGGRLVAALREDEAFHYGIQAGDKVQIIFSKNKQLICDIEYSSTLKSGYIGIYKEITDKFDVESEDIVELNLISRPLSIEAIKKKMRGEDLKYEDIYSIMSDIVQGRLGDIELTYFAMSSFVRPYTEDELYYLTKAMAETGEMINLPEKVVDKHCIGGLAGNRTTMVVIPIIASLGLIIPKTSSRAITSPSGTADTMEVLAPVSFSMEEIKKIVRKTNGCMVWGGGLNLAPADDKIIRVSRPLAMEPYDKMIVSIMAKKVAMGVDHVMIDIPVGPSAKVTNLKIGKLIGEKFKRLGARFGMKVGINLSDAKQPVGNGIGPALEARDVLRVLQQHQYRPLDLENKAIHLAGELLELKGFCRKGQGKKIASEQIKTGKAWEKMNEIIVAQGGKSDLSSEEIIKKVMKYQVVADKSGEITYIDSKAINAVCMNLGTPKDKYAGMHMHCRFGQKIKKGDKLFTLYASNATRLKLGIASINHNQLVYLGEAGWKRAESHNNVPGILLGKH